MVCNASGQGTRRRATGTIDFTRILSSTRTEIHIDELGERLGATREQIESDLNVLMFCGLPPYSPEQLFDIIIDDDFVSMYFNDVFIKPLRLTETEKAHAVIALTRLESQSQEDSDKIRTVIDLLGRRQKMFWLSMPLRMNLTKISGTQSNHKARFILNTCL